MTFLLDTHAFLWLLAGDRRLSPASKRLFVDPANEPLLSVASAWEIAIKTSLGKLTLPAPPRRWLRQELSRNGVELLPISFDHATRVAQLPFHHRDPFDRLIAAQALEENLGLLSADAAFDAYGVTRLW